jgi:hypothetical protein
MPSSDRFDDLRHLVRGRHVHACIHASKIEREKIKVDYPCLFLDDWLLLIKKGYDRNNKKYFQLALFLLHLL